MTNLVRPLPLAVGGMLTLSAAMGIGRFVYTPILPAMADGLGLDAAQAGFLASANFVGYLVGAVVMSLPRLPGERRDWALAGLALSVATTLASGVGTALPLLATIRFLSGVASGLAFVGIAAHVIDHLARSGRAALSAVLFIGPGLGILSSSLLVGALTEAGASWRELWYGSGALAACLLAIVWRLVPRPAPVADARGEHGPASSRMTYSGPLVRAILSYGLFGFAYVITATFIVAITRETATLRDYEHVVWPVVGLAAMPSVAVWNTVGRRIGPARAYALACLLEGMGVVASVASAEPWAVVFAAAALGFTFVGVTSLGLAVARPFGGPDSGRLVGVMTAAFGIGQIVGPGLAGATRAATGSFAWASYGAAGALVVCAVLILSVPDRAPA